MSLLKVPFKNAMTCKQENLFGIVVIKKGY